MPSLLIKIENGNWVARPSGVQNVVYTFVGDGRSNQEAAVRQLVTAMEDGQDAVMAGLPETLQIPANVNLDTVVTQLFKNCDILVYDDIPAFTAIGDDTLWSEIQQVGEWLISKIPF
ncbi:hypothetical protein [Azospirillum palustre]|uniref:hypothetical protein n=1 Tax=Azospirillum palustre TaxID=2044885 RepID=UPI001177B292|nr:hypothetical protein [Azospirillum palustre]